jgi:hypothetical protein
MGLFAAAVIGLGIGLILLTQGNHLLVLALALLGLFVVGLVAGIRRLS